MWKTPKHTTGPVDNSVHLSTIQSTETVKFSTAKNAAYTRFLLTKLTESPEQRQLKFCTSDRGFFCNQLQQIKASSTNPHALLILLLILYIIFN